MTGRAAGYCAGYNVPGFANAGPGMGYGRAGGRGMAWRRGWGGGGGYTPPAYYGWGAPPAAPAAVPPTVPPAGAPQNERAVLEQQVAALQAQLNYLQERLQALGDEPESDKQ